MFPLSRASCVLGRLDRATGTHPDIDLTPLGQGRAISRRHAEVNYRLGEFYLRDLGSRLGTYVNAEQVDPETEWQLKEGDTVTIAGITLTFDLAAEWPEGLEPEWIAKEESGAATDATVLTGMLPLIGQLPRALREGQLLMYYQPQIVLEDGVLKSVEALIRWQHPTMGMVPPDSFIPFAEDTGFIKSITNFAIEASARQALAWSKDGASISVAVNVSVKDLEDPAFGDRTLATVEGVGIPPDQLVIEVTESGVMSRPEKAIATLLSLKEKGFSLSIDDYGTGNSSLSYLGNLPADEVKVDRSFAMNLSPRGEMIIRSTAALGHELDMTVAAEGIESIEIAGKLRELGIDKGQGYFFGKPMPGEEIDPAMKFTT